LLDDDYDELAIYSTLLRHAGYDILATHDPDAAVQLAADHQPDLAIVDMNLHSTKDGRDVIDALRRDDRTSDIPVIIHTAFADVYHARLDSAGSETVLKKPLDCGVLLQVVQDRIGPVGQH
jgi:two-component system cell cycle response regulator DivK